MQAKDWRLFGCLHRIRSRSECWDSRGTPPEPPPTDLLLIRRPARRATRSAESRTRRLVSYSRKRWGRRFGFDALKEIFSVDVAVAEGRPFDVPLAALFTIASNVAVRVELRSGAVGWGRGAHAALRHGRGLAGRARGHWLGLRRASWCASCAPRRRAPRCRRCPPGTCLCHGEAGAGKVFDIFPQPVLVSDPLGWKQKIQSVQQQEDSRKQCPTNKENITIFRSVKDVDKLMYSVIDLGQGFEGEGKTYFSIAVDSISSMLRYASVSSISSFLSNLRSHDQISSIFWLMHSDLHEPKFSRAFECLSTMVACVEPEVVDSVYGEQSLGSISFLEQNYSKAKFHVRLKRRNGRVKHLYEDLHVEGNDVKFVSAPSVSTEVNQSLLPKVQFNLELSEKERTDRANVVLPFEHQGKGEPIRIYDGRLSLPEARRDPNLTASALLDEIKAPKSATAKGEIHYIRDSDDEQPDSDEDPDDDLDI